MKYLFLEYPKCSTCRNAKKWLNDNKVSHIDRHIVEQNPSEKELLEWIQQSKLPLKNFFNTSGLVYKELQLKKGLPTMTSEEQVKLLASNGMLVKRPLLIGEKFVLIGFKAEEWSSKLL